MTRATCHVQGHPSPLVAVAATQLDAHRMICEQIDAFGLAGRGVRIDFERLPDSGIRSPSTVPCDPPTEPVDTDEPDELQTYLAGTRGDWVSAVRVLSYAGGGL